MCRQVKVYTKKFFIPLLLISTLILPIIYTREFFAIGQQYTSTNIYSKAIAESKIGCEVWNTEILKDDTSGDFTFTAASSQLLEESNYVARQKNVLERIIDEKKLSSPHRIASYALAELQLSNLTGENHGITDANNKLKSLIVGVNEENEWALPYFIRIYFLFKDRADLLYPSTRDQILRFLKVWGGNPKQSEPIDIWDNWATENHESIRGSTYLFNNQIFYNNSSDYQHWKNWWSTWFDEHAMKGWAEISSPAYQDRSIAPVYNIYEFSDDPILRKKAEMTLDWIWADWAIEQLNGVRGGGKSRVYQGGSWMGASDGKGDDTYHTSYIVFGNHEYIESGMYTGLVATSEYRPPSVLRDIALDDDRGVYEIKERRPSGFYNNPQKWRGRKYSYVTPDYIMGGYQEGDGWNSEYYAGANDHWWGLIFGTSADARIYPWGRNYMLGGQQELIYDQMFQYENVMIFKVGGNHKSYSDGDAPEEYAPTRMYFSYSLDIIEEDSGWIFVKEGNAYAAFRPVSGGYYWANDPSWEDYTTQGRYIVADKFRIPAILEAARSIDYDSFSAFKNDIKERTLIYSVDNVSYETRDGKLIEVDFRAYYDGDNIKIDGASQKEDLENYKTFESPYIDSEWNSGYIVISTDREKCTLDFSDFNNPEKTCEVIDLTSPHADAGPDQTVIENTLVRFDGSGSSDNIGITSYTWDFIDVDSQTLTGVNPNYVFLTPGLYVVTLDVWDAAGNFATDFVTVTVLDVTEPVADAGSDQTVNEDVLVTFDASGSSDNVGITAYKWEFTEITTKRLIGEKPTYTFNTPGIYTLTLNVTDDAGNWATDTVVVEVLDLTKPIAKAHWNETSDNGTTVTFDAGDSSDNVGIVNCEWDFGDGTTGTGIYTTHTYKESGTYSVILTVKDEAGQSDTDMMTVTINHAGQMNKFSFSLWIAGIIGAALIAFLFLLFYRSKGGKKLKKCLFSLNKYFKKT